MPLSTSLHGVCNIHKQTFSHTVIGNYKYRSWSGSFKCAASGHRSLMLYHRPRAWRLSQFLHINGWMTTSLGGECLFGTHANFHKYETWELLPEPGGPSAVTPSTDASRKRSQMTKPPARRQASASWLNRASYISEDPSCGGCGSACPVGKGPCSHPLCCSG